MVTTIVIDTVEAKDVQTVYAKALKEFEKLLSSENCQLISVSSSETEHRLFVHKQTVTVIWTGNSSRIKSSYRANYQTGLFGVNYVSLQ